MKVILLQDIKGLGKKYDLKEVSDGYARNFLLPQKSAEAATPMALQRLISVKTRLEEEKKKILALLEERAEKIKNLILKFKLKTGEKNEVFGSVSAKEIEEVLLRHGLPAAKIILEKPIKILGEIIVPVDLGEGVRTKLKISVGAEK